MKKLLVILSSFLLVSALLFIPFDESEVFATNFDVQTKTYFVKEPKYEYIFAYPYYIVNKDVESDEAVGKSFAFKANQKRLIKFLSKLDARFVKFEKVENKKVFYFFCDIIDKKIETTFGDVNMQVAVDGENVVVGIPMIFGSF